MPWPLGQAPRTCTTSSTVRPGRRGQLRRGGPERRESCEMSKKGGNKSKSESKPPSMALGPPHSQCHAHPARAGRFQAVPRTRGRASPAEQRSRSPTPSQHPADNNAPSLSLTALCCCFECQVSGERDGSLPLGQEPPCRNRPCRPWSRSKTGRSAPRKSRCRGWP
jgi:hypothetical protein